MVIIESRLIFNSRVDAKSVLCLYKTTVGVTLVSVLMYCLNFSG